MVQPAVHIFLDTNALFTEAADHLIAKDLSEFILQFLGNDLSLHWYIPSVVVGERRFQMLDRAKLLLPHIDKVERLLGHNLNITEDVLSTRVEESIKRHIENHQLNEIGFDQSAVNWQDMVRRAIERKPPFKRGDNEKGFRDAIVLETFCQRVSDLPKSLQSCRIVLLSNDERLIDAARERMEDRNNVTFASSLDDIRTMLNALTSQITQETVNTLLPKAFRLFFETENQRTIWYAAGVQDEIRNRYSDQLNQVPKGWNHVLIQSIHIGSPPTFIEKKGQRLTFSDKIIYRMQAIKYVQRSPADQNKLMSTLLGPVHATKIAGLTSVAAARDTILGPGSSPSSVMGSGDMHTTPLA
jgi:PIN domain